MRNMAMCFRAPLDCLGHHDADWPECWPGRGRGFKATVFRVASTVLRVALKLFALAGRCFPKTGQNHCLDVLS